MKTLIIARGIPGAGKTAFANTLAAFSSECCVMASEDDYWMRDTRYDFSHDTVDDAFLFMANKAMRAMAHDVPLVIIHTAALDITSHLWKRVFIHAFCHDYMVFPLIIQRNIYNPESSHGVSQSEMDRFRRDMVATLEVDIGYMGYGKNA